MRSYLIAGNWKMHGRRDAVVELLEGLKTQLPAEPRADIAVFPPAVYIDVASQVLRGSPVAIGAQNVCDQSKDGAYTGEVSAEMLRDMACRYVIVGHSERRELYGESSALVAQRAKAAIEAGLTPLVCVGENEAQRDAGNTLDVVGERLAAVIKVLSTQQLGSIVVAYEPVWAIGTGKTATPAQAQEVHAFIRASLAKQSEEIAATVRILYGGSVKAGSAGELFAQPDIDGGLVGGASLDAGEFSAICRAAE